MGGGIQRGCRRQEGAGKAKSERASCRIEVNIAESLIIGLPDGRSHMTLLRKPSSRDPARAFDFIPPLLRKASMSQDYPPLALDDLVHLMSPSPAPQSPLNDSDMPPSAKSTAPNPSPNPISSRCAQRSWRCVISAMLTLSSPHERGSSLT